MNGVGDAGVVKSGGDSLGPLVSAGDSPMAEEEAAGRLWGLSGWFARRSGMSPPSVQPQGAVVPPQVGLGVAAASAPSVTTTATATAMATSTTGGTDERNIVSSRGFEGEARGVPATPTSTEAPAVAGEIGEPAQDRRPASVAREGAPVVKSGGVGGDEAGTPAPLSMEAVGLEGQPHIDSGYVTDTDEDEDLYGKTLRPTSEQLVRKES